MYQKLFQKQAMMRRVLIALAPIYLLALYQYGWRLLLLGVLVFVFGIGIEYLVEKTRKRKISEAVFVTCSLYLLSLPAQTPWWIAVLGIAFGVFIAKGIYGGFGRNIFNPAISGRLFVYITFPNVLQMGFLESKNFGIGVDAITTATPLGLLRQGESIDYLMHFVGFRPGSMGEGSILIIIVAAVYLIAAKTANWRMIISTLASAAVLSFALSLFDVPNALPPLASLLSGSIVFVAVFYSTDPVSAPKQKISQFLYGIVIGSTTVLVRTFSLFPEGTSFGILLGNTFASMIDHIFTRRKAAAT